MITATRRFEWDAAHRVLRHESKCATLHGHRYVADVTVSGELDSVGRVIDFGVLKEVLGSWIDERWDHTTLINGADTALVEFCDAEFKRGARAPYVFHGEPTAENIAAQLLEQARALLEPRGLHVVRVRVYETPKCWADALPEFAPLQGIPA